MEKELDLRSALNVLDPRPVLGALALLTGDRSLLDPALQPTADLAVDTVRRSLAAVLAAEAIEAGGLPETPAQHDLSIEEVVTFLTGQSDAQFHALLRTHVRQSPGTPAPTGLRVGIIGGGLSGIASAIRLSADGHAVHILERDSGFGGTWFQNDYPGCRLDTNNFTYTYSFAQPDTWPNFYSTQGEVLTYLEDVAASHHLQASTTFGATVRRCEWVESRRVWQVDYDVEGSAHSEEFDAVVSAVGQLGVPRIPRLTGIDEFAGTIVHSNRWAHDLPVAGKRVGVVGTGATGFQIIPELAEDADQLVVFQRSAPWISPTPEYRQAMPQAALDLLVELPGLSMWYRFWQFWNSVEGRLGLTEIEAGWDDPRSVSSTNESLRRTLTEYIEAQFADRPDLLQKVVPDYPPGSKRMLRDDGNWARTLKRPNVRLETDSIAAVTQRGVRLVTGEEIELDVLVFASGFEASEFLPGIEVRGREGIEIHDFWNGESRAYLGSLVPNFPNLFLVYGPNTNLVVNGSIMFMAECSVDFARSSLQLIDERGGTVEVTPDAYHAFIDDMNSGNARRAWGQPSVTNWYKNSAGAVTQVWPYSLLDFWERTHTITAGDLIVQSAQLAPQSA
ncbi:NAD(P)/FAD-dependent oxidoreductase [Mycetocola sp. 2940]|uniref:flavin-containing monooxygenase n=1 Tax=Mycetocola sp. 2940 TaxID=3156452 RepID=UPI003395C06E